MTPAQPRFIPKTTFILEGLFIAFTVSFLYQIIAAAVHGAPSPAIGFYPAHPFRDPASWVTALFYHGGVSHLVSNSVFFLLFGIPLEKELGQKRFLQLFFFSGWAGFLLAAILQSHDPIGHIGASAAITGMMVYFLLSGMYGTTNASRSKTKSFWSRNWPFLIAGFLYIFPDFILGFAMAKGTLHSHVAYIDHAGGAIGGFVFFDWLASQKEKAARVNKRPVVAAARPVSQAPRRYPQPLGATRR